MVNVSLPLNTHTSESNYLRKWGKTGPCTTCWFPHPAFMVFYCVQMVRVIHQMSQNTQSSWTHFFFGKTITTKTFLLIKQFTTVLSYRLANFFVVTLGTVTNLNFGAKNWCDQSNLKVKNISIEYFLGFSILLR